MVHAYPRRHSTSPGSPVDADATDAPGSCILTAVRSSQSTKGLLTAVICGKIRHKSKGTERAGFDLADSREAERSRMLDALSGVYALGGEHSSSCLAAGVRGAGGASLVSAGGLN